MKLVGLAVLSVVVWLAALASVNSQPPAEPRNQTGTAETKAQLRYPILSSCHLPVHIVYMQTANGQADGPLDIWEMDLAMGKRVVLLSHDNLPEQFAVRPDSVASSPDGRYLGMLASTDVEMLSDGEDPEMKLVGGEVWLFDRKSGVVKRILADKPVYGLDWSPVGRYLLAENGEDVLVYDTDSEKTLNCGPADEVSAAFWWGDGLGVVLEETRGDSTAVYFQPADGRPKKLLFAQTPFGTATAQSPSGRGYVTFDGEKVALLSVSGKQTATFNIPDPCHKDENRYWADFAYNRSGDRLAAMTSRAYGEPHINDEQQLWWIDLKRVSGTRAGMWDESYLGITADHGEKVSRDLQGWLPDGHTILLSGRVEWGGDGVCDNRDDRYRLWSYDVTQAKPECKLVFDSGPGCHGITWW